jgi:hypothetical protein
MFRKEKRSGGIKMSHRAVWSESSYRHYRHERADIGLEVNACQEDASTVLKLSAM